MVCRKDGGDVQPTNVSQDDDANDQRSSSASSPADNGADAEPVDNNQNTNADATNAEPMTQRTSRMYHVSSQARQRQKRQDMVPVSLMTAASRPFHAP